jgi:hypothetical protein
MTEQQSYDKDQGLVKESSAHKKPRRREVSAASHDHKWQISNARWKRSILGAGLPAREVLELLGSQRIDREAQ